MLLIENICRNSRDIYSYHIYTSDVYIKNIMLLYIVYDLLYNGLQATYNLQNTVKFVLSSNTAALLVKMINYLPNSTLTQRHRAVICHSFTRGRVLMERFIYIIYIYIYICVCDISCIKTNAILETC